MADTIRLSGVQPFDGVYEFDITGLTIREWGWVKRHSGYMPATILPGLEGGDTELMAVFAAIAVYRAGRLEQTEVARFIERLQDVDPVDAISYQADETVGQDDAGPPPGSSNGKQPSSGDASQTSSETSTPTPSGSGTPGSATSPSALETWAS